MLQTIAWPAFLVALVVFGFAPGVLLRMIVLCYPRDHPRRRELLAELRAVPRVERPFWVLEQLELAIFEGLWTRVRKIMRDRRGRRSHPAEIRVEMTATATVNATVRVLAPAYEVDAAHAIDAIRVTDNATVRISPPAPE